MPITQEGRAVVRYESIFCDPSTNIDAAGQAAANWQIGQDFEEFEQERKERAGYGEEINKKPAEDLSARYGRGFSHRNVWPMNAFYFTWPTLQTVSAESSLIDIASYFSRPWSAYVRLLTVKNMLAPEFYETEALRGEWPLRQLERQINSQFCERTALSKEKAAMLTKGQRALPKDAVRPKEEIKDPFVLKFLDPKDDYFENTLEEALNRPLETFLLKLGGNFCFVGGQRRLIIGKERYRMDHLFFHRRLRSLVGIDLKIGRFTHAAAGQMHFYFNYARKRWVHDEENPLLVLILCAQKVEANARYALVRLPNLVMPAEHGTTIPDKKVLLSEVDRTREALGARGLSPWKKVKSEPTAQSGNIRKGKRKRGR